MSKNKGFRAYGQAMEHKAKLSLELMKQLCDQCCVDAMILTLSYGECMGNDCWGAQRIDRFAKEWVENMRYVMEGLEGKTQEADFIRADIDKRLKAKVPPGKYVDWSGRYPMFQTETLEEEHAKNGKAWRQTYKRK